MPLLWLMESRWPPSTTTSLGSVVPVRVAMTDGCSQVCVKVVTETSVRPLAIVVHWFFSQVAASAPVCTL